MKAALLAAALVVAIALGTWLQRGSPGFLETNVAATKGSENVFTSARFSGADARMRSAATPTPSSTQARTAPISNDQREFRRGIRYQELHERLSALATPTSEQQFILSEILMRCLQQQQGERFAERTKRATPGADALRARFAETLSSSDPDRDRRIAAYARVQETQMPCTGMPKMADADVTARAKALRESAAAAGHPGARAVKLRDEIYATGRTSPFSALVSVTDESLATLKGIVASGDPFAMQALLTPILNGAFENASMRAGTDQVVVNPAAMSAAMDLLACESTGECGPDSTKYAGECATYGRCRWSDQRDLIYSYQLSPASASVFEEYVAGLRRAQAGDWSYFTIARTASPYGVVVFGR